MKEFNMSQKQVDFAFCGRRVSVTPEALIVSQEFAASSLVPMELCGPQRSAETMLTYSEHREYRSLLGKLQWLELQSRPDRSSAPTIEDASGVSGMGEFQNGHLIYWTSSTIKRVVRSTPAAEAHSVSEAVEEAQWLRSVLAEMWPSVPSSLPRSLRTVEMDSLRPIVTLIGYWIGQTTPNRDGNAETSLLWSTGSDTCVCHNSHDARRCFDAGSGPLSFVACGNERTSPRVRDLRIQHRCEDNIADVPTLKMAVGSQLIRSAESQSGRPGPSTR